MKFPGIVFQAEDIELALVRCPDLWNSKRGSELTAAVVASRALSSALPTPFRVALRIDDGRAFAEPKDGNDVVAMLMAIPDLQGSDDVWLITPDGACPFQVTQVTARDARRSAESQLVRTLEKKTRTVDPAHLQLLVLIDYDETEIDQNRWHEFFLSKNCSFESVSFIGQDAAVHRPGNFDYLQVFPDMLKPLHVIVPAWSLTP